MPCRSALGIPLHPRPGWWVALALLAVAGCAGPAAGAATGGLDVLLHTLGQDPDADGYAVSVDGGAPHTVAVGGQAHFNDLSPGPHQLTVTGVAANCAAQGSFPRTVSVPAGGDATVDITVACRVLGGTRDLLVSPTGVDLGEVEVDATSAARAVTITNTGVAPALVAIGGSALPAPYALTDECDGTTLAPGDACDLAITLNGATTGFLNTPWNVTVNGTPTSITLRAKIVPRHLVVTPTVLEFGEVQVGSTAPEQLVTVTNEGAAPATLGGPSGGASSPFSGGETCSGATLQPGATCTMTYAFSPQTVGASNATVTGTLADTAFSITLRGTGIAAGSTPSAPLLLSPQGFAFGRTPVGLASHAQSMKVTNVSGAPVTVSGAGGAPGRPFDAYQNCQDVTLQPGASCAFVYSFLPTATGSAMGVGAGTVNGIPYSVSLVGEGIRSGVLVDPIGLDFGEVRVGTSSPSQTVAVEATGPTGVVLDVAMDVSPGVFASTDDCYGRAINPGEACEITLTASPTALGSVTGWAYVSVNGTVYEVALAVTGVTPN